ncbi:hypothetical protein PV325_011029, partial [Microctonus aethiopoides]
MWNRLDGTSGCSKEHPGMMRHTACEHMRNFLEALAVDDAWAGFVVFLLGDPHLLEGGQGSKNGTTDPYGVFPFRWSNDLDLD